MKWWMQSLKASNVLTVCFTVVLSACSPTAECDHTSQVGLSTPGWINSSSWLFQTAPLTPSAPLSFSHKTPPPSLKKATEIITSSSHHTTGSAFSLHLFSYPGSKPSHSLMESPPEMISFAPESPVSHAFELFYHRWPCCNSPITRKSSWAHFPVAAPSLCSSLAFQSYDSLQVRGMTFSRQIPGLSCWGSQHLAQLSTLFFCILALLYFPDLDLCLTLFHTH